MFCHNSCFQRDTRERFRLEPCSMHSLKNYTMDAAVGASRNFGGKTPIPSPSVIGEPNEDSTLCTQSRDSEIIASDQQLGSFVESGEFTHHVPESIRGIPSTAPGESETRRNSSHEAESRHTEQWFQGQKRPHEYPLDPSQGQNSQKKRMVCKVGDIADEGTRGAASTQLLACPFSKLDGNQYYGCLKFELRRVKDVKQHILRKHQSPEFYCARCWQTFSDPSRRDEHARVAICTNQPKPLFGGISEKQKNLLRRSTDRRATPEQQWYNIWEILFPGKPRPSSIYLGSFMEETIIYIQNRCQEEGLETILSTLRKKHGEAVDAVLVKDVVDVAMNWFHAIIDKTPMSCQSRPVEMDAFSQSVTSSLSAPISDPDFQTEGVGLQWLFAGNPYIDDLELVDSAVPGVIFSGLNDSWHWENSML